LVKKTLSPSPEGVLERRGSVIKKVGDRPFKAGTYEYSLFAINIIWKAKPGSQDQILKGLLGKEGLGGGGGVTKVETTSFEKVHLAFRNSH